MNLLVAYVLITLQDPQKDPRIPPAPKQPGKTEVRVETPTRSDLTLKESPFAVSAIRKEEMDVERTDSTTELLRQMPGVHLTLNGGHGFITSIFMRGTDSAHTLVLMDGFKVNQDGDNFNHLELYSPRGMGAIEIYRGPGSSVYGSGASGGVVQFVTERGHGDPRAYAGYAYGTRDQNVQHAQLIGQVEQLSFNLVGTRFQQHENQYPNSEAENFNFNSRLDYEFAQRATVKVIGRYAEGRTENYTNGAGDRLSPIDTDAFLEDAVLLLGTEGTFGPSEHMDVVLRWSYYWKDLGTTDLAGPGDFGPFISSTLYYRLNYDVAGRLKMGKQNVLTAGFEHQFERFDRESNFGDVMEHRRSQAMYVQDQLRAWESLFIVGSARFEQNQFFGNETMARLGAAYLIQATQTKVRASWGNSITAPSFLDLFGFGGNPNLNSERTVTFDGGVDQWFFNEALRISATGFENRIEDLIVFSGGMNRNVSRAKTWGAEFEMEFHAPGVEGLSFRMAYTLLETYDATTRKTLIRRPEHSGKVGASYRREEFGISVDVGMTGDRKDLNFAGFPAVRQTVPGYVKVDLGAYVRLWQDVRLTARVDNAFDETYQDVLGFTAPKFTALFGIEAGISAPEIGAMIR
jgi:vitamin B12 transporter